jgi:hypothetical protein
MGHLAFAFGPYTVAPRSSGHKWEFVNKGQPYGEALVRWFGTPGTPIGVTSPGWDPGKKLEIKTTREGAKGGPFVYSAEKDQADPNKMTTPELSYNMVWNGDGWKLTFTQEDRPIRSDESAKRR